MEYLNGQTIVGFFFVVGGVAIVLQRVGILNIPTTRKEKQDNPKNDKDGDKKITSLKEVQLVQAEILRQHDERLKSGNKRFNGIEADIGKINTNVGILLDRTK